MSAHKATTYPHSDCGYLLDSMQADIPGVLSALLKTEPNLQPLLTQLNTQLKSCIWNDKKSRHTTALFQACKQLILMQ